MDPATMAAIGAGVQVQGGILQAIGAFGQKKEAKKQIAAQQQFAGQQRGRLEAGYGDLLAAAQGLPTYKGDISAFQRLTEFQKGQMQLAGGRIAGEDIARERIAQQTANVLGSIFRGGRSSQDILSSVLFATGQGSEALRDLEPTIMQMRQQRQDIAAQGVARALEAEGIASQRQRAMEFESQAQKAQTLLGLKGERMQAGLNLEQQLFEDQQAKRAALADARASIWAGFGGAFQKGGEGMMSLSSTLAKSQDWKNSKNGTN